MAFCRASCRAEVIFVYKEGEPRLSRVLMITTAIITLMFASAALDAYVDPDSSVCADYTNTTEVGGKRGTRGSLPW